MQATVWRAPHAKGPVFGAVTLPGSKSLSARELLLGAISDTEASLTGVLYARDTDLMVQALRSLGAVIEPWPPVVDQPVQITPLTQLWSQSTSAVSPGGLRDNVPVTVDCGLAGTVMRFIPAVAVALGSAVRLVADTQANTRPMRPLLDALTQWGAHVEYESPDGRVFPCTIYPPVGRPAAEVTIDATASSQFISALLLAAPLLPDGCTVRSKTAALPSLPHIEMTLECLSQHGVTVAQGLSEEGKPFWHVAPEPVLGQDVLIEPDLSNAGPFLALAGIAGGRISIPTWPANTTQAGAAWLEILPRMGLHVEWNYGVLTVSSRGPLWPIDADFTAVGELVPTVAALAAFAPGTSRLRGLHHLRGHETDRLEALRTELTTIGIPCEITPEDDLVITGVSPSRLWDKDSESPPLLLHSYGDHRLATFAALLGLYYPVQIDDIDATSKTLPDFTKMWERLLGAAS